MGGPLGGLILRPTAVPLPTDNLILHYSFTGNANDESGNGNNGTVNGATLVNGRDGSANGAYSFDGINDEITANGSASLSSPATTNELTISIWVKNLNIAQNNRYIFQYRSNTYSLIYGFVGDNYEYFQTFPAKRFNSGLAIDNDWNHVFIRIDSGGSSQSYYNNVKISDIGSAVITLNSGGSTLTIGSAIGANNSNVVIDDFRVYDRSLNDTEKDLLFNE